MVAADSTALMDVSKLRAAADVLKSRLATSQSTSDQMGSILGSFDERLSTLETAMRQTQIRPHAFRKVHKNIDETLKQAEEVLANFDVGRQVEPRIKEGPKHDLDGYLRAVDRLHGAVLFFSKNCHIKSSESALQHARELLKESLVRLEEDFRNRLAANSNPVDPDKAMASLSKAAKVSATDSVLGFADYGGKEEGLKGPERIMSASYIPALLPPAVINRLHSIAERLISGGCAQQCITAFRDVRDKTLEQSLRKLGMEKLKSEDVYYMQWEELEGRINGWIKQIRVATLILFASEKKLCDAVFAGLEPYRERTFAEVADAGATMLFSFGEAIASSKKSPEKLFALLDMFETLRDLMPHVNVVFCSGACLAIREAGHGLLQRLAKSARETFSEFEEVVEKDDTKAPVPCDGAKLPLTSYVINYMKFLFEYHATLQQLFGETTHFPSSSSTPNSDDGCSEGKPRLAVATARIMAVLQSNLEAKSKLYRDPALSHLFLMNNVHYMVQSVCNWRYEAKEMLGDDWVPRHRRIVQQHATAYQRAAWTKVLACITPMGGAGESTVNKTAVKERFKQFNAAFEEVHSRQCGWTIPVAELRSAVQLKIVEVLVPAYRSFLKRYSSLLEQGGAFGKSQAVQKYIRYQADDIENSLRELFEGKQCAPGNPAR